MATWYPGASPSLTPLHTGMTPSTPLPPPNNLTPRVLTERESQLVKHLSRLQFFLATAPTRWMGSEDSATKHRPSLVDASLSSPHPNLNKFLLPNGEHVACVFWNGLYHITGTDIVRALVFRFEAFSRPVRNVKKFEEGVFSDLRNLKPGTDACLEEPKPGLPTSLRRSRVLTGNDERETLACPTTANNVLFSRSLLKGSPAYKQGRKRVPREKRRASRDGASTSGNETADDESGSETERLRKQPTQTPGGASISLLRPPSKSTPSGIVDDHSSSFRTIEDPTAAPLLPLLSLSHVNPTLPAAAGDKSLSTAHHLPWSSKMEEGSSRVHGSFRDEVNLLPTLSHGGDGDKFQSFNSLGSGSRLASASILRGFSYRGERDRSERLKTEVSEAADEDMGAYLEAQVDAQAEALAKHSAEYLGIGNGGMTPPGYPMGGNLDIPTSRSDYLFHPYTPAASLPTTGQGQVQRAASVDPHIFQSRPHNFEEQSSLSGYPNDSLLPFSSDTLASGPVLDGPSEGDMSKGHNVQPPSQKSFIVKQKLAKKARQNRPLPQWFRLKTDNKIQYNAKRRHWRRTKLNL
ncbi:60S ribosomal protein L39 [Cryptococcus amylolentus CBS 6273]|uniref:60S ribosomal protein L39 n=1 Tax=Cryptococcus amylolentus CBS 6273 TaxID=1296118 RepID=A0A1E3JQJ9_9TREE|nr:60S ribosomal protein L39 [Cryptococcus amylolentus CBS 6273]